MFKTFALSAVLLVFLGACGGQQGNGGDTAEGERPAAGDTERPAEGTGVTGGTDTGETGGTTPADGTAPTTTGGGTAGGPTPTTEAQRQTTASGLQYVDLVEGTGATPTAGQTVSVHYTGWLTTGQKFDSSVDRGQPFSFPIGMGRVIRGWDEGVMTMKVGGKRQLIIPPNLAYGERGTPGGPIPPNSTLVFDVELLSVQ